VTGESRGSGTFDDYATVKYNSSGQEQWVARYNGPGNSGDGANAIAVDGSGNIYVTGSSYNSDSDIKDDWDYATVKYNSEGQEQWVARYNGPGNSSDEANAIAVDGSGNVYVTGSSVGSGTSFDYMTVKYNSEGQEQWVARYNGPGNGNDYANAIAVDGSGNIYVTGESYDSGTSSDYATVKYNSSGEEQWVARYNGPENSVDRAHAIAIDGSDVYVSGVSAGLGTSYDYATVKYNSAGEEQWVARYNGPGNSYDYVTAIAVDGSGNVYVTGYSEGNKWSVYTTIKYSGETGIVDEIINLPSTVYLGNNYPNPFNSSTTIQYTLPRNEYVRLSIYSISGQLVKTIENGVRSVGVHTESWNGTDARGRSATSGIYFYRLEAGGETFVKKMVLMR
jgi:sugar lactone lactonase YvrE